MSMMSDIATELELDWTPTWSGYQHNHSDYYIVESIDNLGHVTEYVLESKTWPHPIKTGDLAELVHYVSKNGGFSWSRYDLPVDIGPPDDHDDIRVGVVLAGLATMAVGAALWALIFLAAWWALG